MMDARLKVDMDLLCDVGRDQEDFAGRELLWVVAGFPPCGVVPPIASFALS